VFQNTHAVIRSGLLGTELLKEPLGFSVSSGDTLELSVTVEYGDYGSDDMQITLHVIRGADLRTFVTTRNSASFGTASLFGLSGRGGKVSARMTLDYDTFAIALAGGAAIEGYDLWAATWNTNIGAANNDHDADGFSNLYEYGLGGNPTNSAVSGALPTFTRAGTRFFYIHPQRSDDTNLVYTVETRTNLVHGVWTNAGYTITGTNVTGGELNFVTNEVDTALDEKFIRLKIAR
jgi:hypothetical protein